MVAIPINNMNLRTELNNHRGRPTKYNWDKFVKESSFLTLVEGSRTLCVAQFIPLGEYGIDTLNTDVISDGLQQKKERQKITGRVRSTLMQYLVKHHPLDGDGLNTANKESIYKLFVMTYTHEGTEGVLVQAQVREDLLEEMGF